VWKCAYPVVLPRSEEEAHSFLTMQGRQPLIHRTGRKIRKYREAEDDAIKAVERERILARRICRHIERLHGAPSLKQILPE